ncbi:methyltransferase domain-containing protein [Desulforhopalus vacuolatus]|uniref:class I SAM-dependent methyltransferase n=1 Tax=Desulforhopalus vacuolatus TaxID=40414 RepID=UPI0019657EAD|nr:class I SAM-dependent methyltransferase [Desulforhopalus vacuolatus]MBM9520959.1 methyltransferase domain-containing protein [Desulforhopalus vacuolatus]
MAVTLYDSYDAEPEDVFEALPEGLYRQFYDLEMAETCEDARHWDRTLPSGNILELGCGSGRVTHGLVRPDRQLVAIDLSTSMLTQAQKLCRNIPPSQRPALLRMDMTAPAFAAASFHGIVIPWNTLNLLSGNAISHCLSSCRELLRKDGLLGLHLHIPGENFRAQTTHTFQFKIFDMEGGGCLIKETLRKFNPLEERIEIEERYRLRPMKKGKENRDFSTEYTICGWERTRWRELFAECGLQIREEKEEEGWLLLLGKDGKKETGEGRREKGKSKRR